MDEQLEYKLLVKIYSNYDLSVSDISDTLLRKIKLIFYLYEKKVAKMKLYVFIIIKLYISHPVNTFIVTETFNLHRIFIKSYNI